ncbi:MAG: hypothetical protein KKA28_18720 [Planctomycetes bacterium]|nr:hypothetical protein [Planctomycetota bacterium]
MRGVLYWAKKGGEPIDQRDVGGRGDDAAIAKANDELQSTRNTLVTAIVVVAVGVFIALVLINWKLPAGGQHYVYQSGDTVLESIEVAEDTFRAKRWRSKRNGREYSLDDEYDMDRYELEDQDRAVQHLIYWIAGGATVLLIGVYRLGLGYKREELVKELLWGLAEE